MTSGGSYGGGPYGGYPGGPAGPQGQPSPGQHSSGQPSPYARPEEPGQHGHHAAPNPVGPTSAGQGPSAPNAAAQGASGQSPYGQNPYTFGQPSYGQGSGYPAGGYGVAGGAPGTAPMAPSTSIDQLPPAPKKRGGGKAALALGAVVLALAAGGVGGVIGANVASDGTTSTSSSEPLGGDPNTKGQAEVEAPPGSVQEVAANVLPSVVSIDVRQGNRAGEGSGVILTADGVIMTNNHVVAGEGGQPVSEVVVNFSDGTRAPAQVRGADPISDIAVIKVDKTGLKPITIGTSNNLAVGQNVIAIGAPLGLAGTVTTGIISALNRPVSTSGEGGGTTSVIDAIQTDAAINPGNSGGALVNARGALIGVNTAIATLGAGSGGQQAQSGSIGLGFAIPINQAIRVANELKDGKKATQAGLGVSVNANATADNSGAVISDVTAGGPANKAGIPKGAVVTKVGDRNIASGDALVAAIRSHAPGDQVSITYVVNGQTKTAQVTLETLQTN